MIMAKQLSGPIVDAVLKFQMGMGDGEAFRYLSAEADDLHATPFGFCVKGFTVTLNSAMTFGIPWAFGSRHC